MLPNLASRGGSLPHNSTIVSRMPEEAFQIRARWSAAKVTTRSPSGKICASRTLALGAILGGGLCARRSQE